MLTHDQLDQHHNEVPPNYYEQGIKKNLLQKIWHHYKYQAIAEILRGQGHGKALDLGCHAGRLTNYLQQLFPQASLFGLDISRAAISYAQQKYPGIDFKVGDITTRLPYPDATFNLVTSFDVLEHVLNLAKVFAEVARVLQSGGYLVIGVPQENLLWQIIWPLWLRAKGKVWQDLHVQKLSVKDLADLSKNFGLRLPKERF